MFAHTKVCLKKNYLLKRRRPFGTLCEIGLPVLLVSCLVIGWSFASDDDYGDQQYTTIPYNPIIRHPIFNPENDWLSNSSLICQFGSEIVGMAHCPKNQYPPYMGYYSPGFVSLPIRYAIPGLRFPIVIPKYNAYMAARIMRYMKLGLALTPWKDPNVQKFWDFIETRYGQPMRYMTIVYDDVYWDPIYFDSEKEAIHCMTTSERCANKFWALINFNTFDLTTGEFDFTIRMNLTEVPATFRTHDFFSSGGLGSEKYYEYLGDGFTTLQYLLYEFIFDQAGIKDPPRPVEILMPTKAYVNDTFLSRAGGLIPTVIVFAYLYFVSVIVKSIVEEKETRIREGMLIMGLSKQSLYLSWFLTCLIVVTLSSIAASTLMGVTFLHHSSPVLVFLFMFTFSMSLVGLSFALSTFFSKAKLAAMVSPLVLVAMTVPMSLLNSETVQSFKIALCLPFSPSTFQLALSLVINYESSGSGAQWASWGSDDPSFSTLFLLLLFNNFVYFGLGLYFDAVVPSEYGVSLHPLFFCFPSFWKKVFGHTTDNEENCNEPPSSSGEQIHSSEFIEQLDTSARPTIVIQNLRKTFPKPDSRTGQVAAVDNVNLKFYENQIQVILGHNGAGKTTTINMLTGMMPPTQGQCTIYGKSILRDMKEIRASIGFCPQHNILWPTLTAREHLEFYGGVKNVANLPSAIDEILKSVELTEKADAFSSVLSGQGSRNR